MKIVSELYDKYFLVYDADEEPPRFIELTLGADADDILVAKKELKAMRMWELYGVR
jgi:hypothetical protein